MHRREGQKIKMSEERRELSLPPDVEANGGTEILRLFITDGALSLSMQRAFESPQMWGQLLAELARQVAEIYARETPILADDAFAEIRAALEAGFDGIAEDRGRIN
jgi:hypothetical protein